MILAYKICDKQHIRWTESKSEVFLPSRSVAIIFAFSKDFVGFTPDISIVLTSYLHVKGNDF